MENDFKQNHNRKQNIIHNGVSNNKSSDVHQTHATQVSVSWSLVQVCKVLVSTYEMIYRKTRGKTSL
jgi:hypothetical protein